MTVVVLAAASAGAPAAQVDVADNGCRSCSGTGVRDCAKHRGVLELERAVLQCSVAAACPSCAGALVRSCRSCVHDAADAELERRAKAAAEWLAARRQSVDEVTGGKEILHLETAHLDLSFSVRPQTVGRQKLDTHRLMHLYGERIEDLRSLFMTTFGYTDKSFSARLDVYLFKDRLDFARLAPRVTGGGANANSSKLMGAHCAYCAVHDERFMPGDEGLHRSVVHNVTHLLLANAEPAAWLGNRKAGWVDEGVAHWFEDKLTGKCTNFCYEEVGLTAGAGFKGGRWRVPLRKMVEAGKLGDFARLSQLNTDEMSFADHAHAFACIDYLLAVHGGPAVAKMVDQLKRKIAARDAMQDAFGIGPLRFDEDLKEWIRQTYPLQETN